MAAMAATSARSMLPMYVVKKMPGSARASGHPEGRHETFGKSFM